jgi:hypothetical protein
LIKLFNDEEYLKIKKTAWDEVDSVLLNGKRLLRLSFYSLMKSMRKDPDKYTALTYYVNNNALWWPVLYRLFGK